MSTYDYTLETGEWPLPFTEEQVDDIWACDWEDEVCPACGRDNDSHTSAQFTRCAQQAL